jgi:DNA-binding NarL/FixJ family response regulator
MFQVYLPSLVIADYQLPESRHGLQLLTEVRRLNPSTRLLLLSAYIDEQDITDIEALGLVDRAIPKSKSNVTTEIVAEIEAAKERAATPTDWSSYAKSHRQWKAVQQSEIDELDGRLKSTRGIN